MEAEFEITEGLVTDLLGVVDAGLVYGVGSPKPGKMCVEAAVCYAMGLPHSDKPTCVSPALREIVVRLNDSSWSSNEARAKGLRRLAVAQLGSAGVLDEKELARRVVDLAIRKYVPIALDAARAADAAYAAAASAAVDAACAAARDALSAASAALAARAARDVAYVAAAAADAVGATTANAADARDKHLSEFAEDVVQILIEMNVPGTEWLVFTEAA